MLVGATRRCVRFTYLGTLAFSYTCILLDLVLILTICHACRSSLSGYTPYGVLVMPMRIGSRRCDVVPISLFLPFLPLHLSSSSSSRLSLSPCLLGVSRRGGRRYSVLCALLPVHLHRLAELPDRHRAGSVQVRQLRRHFGPFSRFLSLILSHVRLVVSSTKCPCFLEADRSLLSDAMPDSRRQVCDLSAAGIVPHARRQRLRHAHHHRM